MESQLEELSPVMARVTVDVPWERVGADLESAFGAKQRTARVRGFRLGKVPRELVRSLLGKTTRAEVASALAREAVRFAVDHHKLETVAYQDVSPAEIFEGQSLTVVAKIEVRPKIERVEVEGIVVHRVAGAPIGTLHQELADAVVDRNPLTPPPSMVDLELRRSIEQYAKMQAMMSQPVNFSEATQDEFRRRADRKVRAGLLFKAIAKLESIEATPADMDERVLKLATESGKHVAKVRAEHKGEQWQRLEIQVLEDKILAWLLERVTVEDVEMVTP